MSSIKTTNEANTVERNLKAEIKLYYDLHVPEASAPSAAPLLIVLHGYRGNKRQMMREALSIAPPSFAIASLQGFHQHIRKPKEEGGALGFGFGWLTNFHPEESTAVHHRALLDLIDALVDEGTARRERIFLLGFSQSCALNYRFAFTRPDCLRGVVGICGGVPGDWESSELYKPTNAAVFHLHGAQDEFYPPSRVQDYAEQLGRRARDVRVKNYDAAHEITDPMRRDVRAWLQERVT
jgi:phospholipase/carboxylesterase